MTPMTLEAELISFIQWIQYYGGEALVSVSGHPISQTEATHLVDIYIRTVVNADA